jgi:hypothetical protein
MLMLLAARSAVAWICIVFGLLIFLGYRYLRGRRRTFDRMRRRLEEADERCSFALATARSAGQELTALKLTHERLKSGAPCNWSDAAPCWLQPGRRGPVDGAVAVGVHSIVCPDAAREIRWRCSTGLVREAEPL